MGVVAQSPMARRCCRPPAVDKDGINPLIGFGRCQWSRRAVRSCRWSVAVDSQTRLQQRRLPTAVWTVTELNEGSSYTWQSSSPGVTVTAAHAVEPHPDGSRLTLALTLSGPLSGIGWLLTRSLTKRFVDTEAASIKTAAETSVT